MSMILWIALGAGVVCLGIVIVAIWNYPSDGSF